MATYAIGDIQGCLQPLKALLARIHFNPAHDRLWIAGDMVNRGPESLETLRFLFSIRHAVTTVLGNHDLHLLAIERGFRKPNRSDTLDDILQAPDKDTLLAWLRKQPLLYRDTELGFTMVHAGIPPQWDIDTAIDCAAEVEHIIQSDQLDDFLSQMYGNTPHEWSDDLRGMPRFRLITNYLTRMRFCSAQGALELNTKGGLEHMPQGCLPWFMHPSRKTSCEHIIFGHWAALQGQTNQEGVFALDTGCVWGQTLSAMRLEDQQHYHVECPI